jgi:hypothetical protein
MKLNYAGSSENESKKIPKYNASKLETFAGTQLRSFGLE